MEAQSTVNATSIAALLTQTYSGESATIQKQAEVKLEQLASNTNFVSSLQCIIHDQSLNENIRSAAAVYLSKQCKSLSVKDNDTTRVLLIVIQLLESGVDISLKRHIGNALKHLIFKDNHKSIRLELFSQLIQKLKLLKAAEDFKEYEYESCAFVAAALIQTAGVSNEEKQVLFVLVSAIYEFITKATRYVQQSLTESQLEVISLRRYILVDYRLMLMRELCRLILSIVKLVKIQETPEFVAFFCVPGLDSLLVDILQLKTTTESVALFSHDAGKKSPLLNELKHHIIHGLDLMMRKLSKLVNITLLKNSQLPNCTTQNNLPKYAQFLMSEIMASLINKKYYKMQSRAINLLEMCIKFLRTCLKLPHMDSFFNGCRKQLLFDIIMPLLELNPNQIDNYINQPDEFVNYLYGIANQEESEQNQDDEWQMQINVASLLTIFCSSQHGTLNVIFEFVMTRLTSCSVVDSNILLIMIAILRDSTKERPDIHKVLKNYLDTQISKLLQDLFNTNQQIVRTLKLYIIHKYNLFISQIDQNFLGIAAKLALVIIQTDQLRDDQALQIIALEILANTCDIGEIVMANTAEQTFCALIPLIQQPVNHRLYDTIQDIIKSYQEKLSDDAITQCMHQLVCKIESETINKQPPVISNKCWNIIREIGDSDYFIPRLIIPIEAEVLKLQKYLQKPEEVDFEEDFLLLCTSFIKKCKKITANQLSLFECFSKIFEKYGCTFGHMFETMSYFIYYGSNILKESPNAVNYAVQICIKSLILSESPKSNQADQCQGALLLQSLIICSSEAFTQQSLWNVIEILRQRLQTSIKYDFLKANLLCALGLALTKVWKIIDRGQAQLLLMILLTNASCCKADQHPSRLMVLILSQLMVIDDPITQNKLSLMIGCIIDIVARSIVKTKNSQQQKVELTTQLIQYDLGVKSYMSPIQHIDECELFRNRFEQIRKQYPQQTTFALSQLFKEQQNLLKNIIKMEKVGGEGRLKLTVKRPVN